MADGTEATGTVTDVAGIARTTDGTLAPNPSEQTGITNPPPTSETKPETKPEGTKEGETLLTEKGKDGEGKEGDKGKETKPEGAPEKYTDYKLPEGMTLDAETKTQVDGLFKGLNLTQDQAQSLIDFQTARDVAQREATAAAFKQTVEDWGKEAIDAPDLRGKLGAGKEITVRINQALDGLGDPAMVSDFRKAMNDTGVGNLAPFIRVLNAFASKVTEGSHVAGKGPSTAGQSKPGEASKPSAGAALWPTLPSSSTQR